MFLNVIFLFLFRQFSYYALVLGIAEGYAIDY